MREEIHKRIQDTLHLAGQAAQGPSLERCASVLLQLAEDHEKLAFELLGPPPIPAPSGRLVGAQREALPPVEMTEAALAIARRDRDEAIALLYEIVDGPCRWTSDAWLMKARAIVRARVPMAKESANG